MCAAASCGNCGGPCAPATGTWYAWFGGAGGADEVGTLSQTFSTSTAGAAIVRFMYYLPYASGVTADSTTLSVDGNQLWYSTGVDSVQYGSAYTPVVVTIPALAAGSHSIDIYGHETGSGGTYNSLIDDITMWVGGAIGYTEYDLSEGVAITFNNPDHFVNIAFTLPTAMDLNVSITDMSGRVVASQDMKQVTNNYVNFNTMNYAAGVYNIVINNGFTTNVHKLVIQ